MEQQLGLLLRKIAIVSQNPQVSLHNQSIVDNLCMTCTSLDRWIMNRWVVYREKARPLHLAQVAEYFITITSI